MRIISAHYSTPQCRLKHIQTAVKTLQKLKTSLTGVLTNECPGRSDKEGKSGRQQTCFVCIPIWRGRLHLIMALELVWKKSLAGYVFDVQQVSSIPISRKASAGAGKTNGSLDSREHEILVVS